MQKERQIEEARAVYENMREYSFALKDFMDSVASEYEFHEYRLRLADLMQEYTRIQRLLLHISIYIKDLEDKE